MPRHSIHRVKSILNSQLRKSVVVVPLTKPRRNDTATEIYAVVASDQEGNEGIMGMLSPEGWVPLVSCRWHDMEMLRPHLKEIAQAQKHVRVIIRKFSAALDIETIEA